MHGIQLLENNNSIVRFARRSLAKAPGIMEFGVSRDYGSSSVLAKFALECQSELVLVDPNEATLEQASKSIEDSIHHKVIHEKGEDVAVGDFANMGVFHLDGFDIVTAHKHKASTIEAYAKVGIDLLADGNVLAAQSHFQIAQKLVAANPEGPRIVLFDDTWCSYGGEWKGKGATAVPYLISNGFVPVSPIAAPFWQLRRYKWGMALFRPH